MKSMHPFVTSHVHVPFGITRSVHVRAYSLEAVHIEK